MRSLAEEAMMHAAHRALLARIKAHVSRVDWLMHATRVDRDEAEQKVAFDEIEARVIREIWDEVLPYTDYPRFVFDTLAIPNGFRRRTWVRLARLNMEA